MFPHDQHKQVFLDLSQYLKVILSQRLVVGKDGYKQNRIELEEALQNADSRSNLEARINFG